MDFSKASLAELRQFTKDNGIKGCSGMKKAELAQFLIKYVEEHVTAVSVENKKNVSLNDTSNSITVKNKNALSTHIIPAHYNINRTIVNILILNFTNVII